MSGSCWSAAARSASKAYRPGQLHQDGSFYTAMPINLQSDHTNDDGPKRLFQRGLELDLVALVQAAAAWAAETGSAGDLMLSAARHRFDDSASPCT
ncbi:hypothetical protein [Streptomyces sioyaensis]|uniref:hypothetical protein n=1 Tax=Streptomyces sioyaensis TaxID=67364 RepID=UPI0036E10957